MTEEGVRLVFEDDIGLARLGGADIFIAKKGGGIYLVKTVGEADDGEELAKSDFSRGSVRAVTT